MEEGTPEEEILGACFIQAQEGSQSENPDCYSVSWLAILHKRSVHVLRIREYDEYSTDHEAAPMAGEGPLNGFMWGLDD